MSDAADFLYPFIEGDERDVGTLLVDLSRSAEAKVTASAELRRTTLDNSTDVIERAATAMTDRFVMGGRLFVFGNGGSSTDAASLASLFVRPPWGQPLPARNLVDDSAVLTALGNDVGFELVFSRQLIAHAGALDIAVGLSTSGNSRNLLQCFAEAAGRGLLTIGLAGYNGGPYRIKRLWKEAGDTGSAELDNFLESLKIEESKTYVKRILLLSDSYSRLYPELAESG